MKLRGWLRQLWCGFWGGHEWLRQFGAGRVWLQCTSCGRETPGLSAGCQRKAA